MGYIDGNENIVLNTDCNDRTMIHTFEYDYTISTLNILWNTDYTGEKWNYSLK